MLFNGHLAIDGAEWMGAMEGKGLGLSLQAGDASEDLRLVIMSGLNCFITMLVTRAKRRRWKFDLVFAFRSVLRPLAMGTRDGEDIWPCPTESTFTTGNKEEWEEKVTANAVQ